MEIHNVSFGYGETRVLKDITLKIRKNAITTLIGANGCGKTTLLRLMTKSLTPQSGSITLNNRNIQKISSKEFARYAAIVHQKNTAPHDLSVKNLVSYGRIPYGSVFKYGSLVDDKVKWAMEVTGISEIAERRIGTLSGGQRQRAFIAMALAQDTKMLFLDEPTTFLDVRYQIEILRLVKSLNLKLGMTVVMVLHDMNQAIAYSDEIIALKDGYVYTKGEPNNVIGEQEVADIYGISLKVCEVNGVKTVLAI